jgi:hypothetical protein
MDAARQIVTNMWERSVFRRDQLLGDPVHLSTLDYGTIESANVAAEVTLCASRSGEAHGLAVWFDAVLHGDIGYSNAPGEAETVYGTGFFPFPEPVEVHSGDRVIVKLRADLVGVEYVCTWDTTVFRAGEDDPDRSFHQSTFFGGPMAIDRVRKRAANHRPALNADGEIDAAILRAMTGKCPVDAITTQLLERFPDRFRSRAEALSRVSDLSERYSQ